MLLRRTVLPVVITVIAATTVSLVVAGTTRRSAPEGALLPSPPSSVESRRLEPQRAQAEPDAVLKSQDGRLTVRMYTPEAALGGPRRILYRIEGKIVIAGVDGALTAAIPFECADASEEEVECTRQRPDELVFVPEGGGVREIALADLDAAVASLQWTRVR